MWKKVTLTEANPTQDVSFRGRGSIYAEGTFASATVRVYILYQEVENGLKVESSGFLDSAIDGSTIKSIDVPSGHYRLKLNTPSGASVEVYYNDQHELVID